jgi:hypothetical protein
MDVNALTLNIGGVLGVFPQRIKEYYIKNVQKDLDTFKMEMLIRISKKLRNHNTKC